MQSTANLYRGWGANHLPYLIFMLLLFFSKKKVFANGKWQMLVKNEKLRIDNTFYCSFQNCLYYKSILNLIFVLWSYFAIHIWLPNS